MNLLDKREIQLASHQKSIKGSDMLPVLPPITSEYNDDLDPMEEEIKEAVEAARDIELFEKQISTRPQRKEPVDEHALVLD
ncbi:hypothetical protein EB796_012402 [Bugula neritina]|uniref:Uncharacterized protein n=1 Tax=Bugula neritina TaxID=10212 RepID=A0A7J7JTP4_BUGNE|nr:hypothetical protein EB796_012402 [Bugula neritina]